VQRDVVGRRTKFAQKNGSLDNNASNEWEKIARTWQSMYEKAMALKKPAEAGFDERYPVLNSWVN
jgi:hypothetical protein